MKANKKMRNKNLYNLFIKEKGLSKLMCVEKITKTCKLGPKPKDAAENVHIFR